MKKKFRGDTDAAVAALSFTIAVAFGAWLVSNFPSALPQATAALAAVTALGAVAALLLVGAARLLSRRTQRSKARLTLARLLRHATTGAVVSELALPALLVVGLVVHPADVVGLLGGTY